MTTSDSTTLLKRCTHCCIEKPATPEYFARQTEGKYGLRADCKDCHRARQKNYLHAASTKEKYKADAEHTKAVHRADPSVCNRPDVLKRCMNCREQFPSTPQYFHRNATRKDGLSKTCKACVKAYHSEYHRRPEVILHVAAYIRRPQVIDRRRAIFNNRRAAVGTFTAADIESIRKAQGNRCYICHKELSKYHIDHFIPLSKGGTNDAGNLRLACPECNWSKNAKHPFELGILL